jgi:hypothetical protein
MGDRRLSLSALAAVDGGWWPNRGSSSGESRLCSKRGRRVAYVVTKMTENVT